MRSPPWQPERCLLEGDVGAARGPRRPRAQAGPGGRQGRRLDREALARRGRRAGAGPRRLAGARHAGSAGAGARAARRARRDAASARRERAGRLRGDPRPGRSGCAARAAVDVPERIAGAWLGRAVGCVLGKPVENIPREGIRAIAEATGNWPVAGWFTAAGSPGGGLGALAVEPREPPDEPRREHRRDPGGRRPQLHDARRRAARALRHRVRRARRREDLARLHAARPDLHRRAGGDEEPARGVPAAARRRRAATRSASGSARGCAWTPTAGRRRAIRSRPRGWRGRTRASATPRTASTRRCSWRRRTQPRCRSRPRPPARTPGSPSCPRAAGWPRRCGRPATSPASVEWEDVVDELYARYATTTGCTRSTTPRSSPRRSTPSTATSPAASRAVVQGGLDTDTNGAAVGSILGALAGPGGIEERWSAPLKGRFASSLPGFDGITIDELVQRTLAVAAAPPRREHPAGEAARPPGPAADRPADRGAARARRGARRRSTRRRSSPRPTIRPTGPPGARR